MKNLVSWLKGLNKKQVTPPVVLPKCTECAHSAYTKPYEYSGSRMLICSKALEVYPCGYLLTGEYSSIEELYDAHFSVAATCKNFRTCSGEGLCGVAALQFKAKE